MLDDLFILGFYLFCFFSVLVIPAYIAEKIEEKNQKKKPLYINLLKKR
jgi:hypothetical protein